MYVSVKSSSIPNSQKVEKKTKSVEWINKNGMFIQWTITCHTDNTTEIHEL